MQQVSSTMILVLSLLLLSSLVSASAQTSDELDIVPLISNGKNSNAKFVAGVTVTIGGTTRSCTGAVLNDPNAPNAGLYVYVLTAGQCVIDATPDQIQVWFGSKTNVAPTERISVHLDYSGRNKLNDLALLKIPLVPLTGALPWDYTNVSPIALPRSNQDYPNYFRFKIGTIYGYGTGTTLQQADVQILSQKHCTLAVYYNQGAPKQKGWDGKVICTSGRKSSICDGDYGGPLVTDNVLVGIASKIIKKARNADCGTAKINAFTFTGSYLGWIKEASDNVVVIQ